MTESSPDRQALLSADAAKSGAAGVAGVPAAVTGMPARRTLDLADPLAHRALESLLQAEASLRRRLSADLRSEGLSTPGFSVLIVLVTAGGELQLRALRRRLGFSKPNATEVLSRLQARGFIERRRLSTDRRAAAVVLTSRGRDTVARLFPEHSGRVSSAFAALDDAEKRSLTSLCRKIAA